MSLPQRIGSHTRCSHGRGRKSASSAAQDEGKLCMFVVPAAAMSDAFYPGEDRQRLATVASVPEPKTCELFPAHTLA